ncbi:MAG: bifunctional glutamate N-acetyltransferase/amino-acid acetyltransferase ArgJ [Aureliella sp.]
MTSTEHHLPTGFRFAGVSCGIKNSGKKDIALIVSDHPAVAAGVYTQNQVVAAPVTLCRTKTPRSTARAVVVNSGNANACTGAQGEHDATRMCDLVAEHCKIDADDCLVMSTGIIGHTLPMNLVEQGIKSAAGVLATTQEAFTDAADGILTTDQGRKVLTAKIDLGDRQINIAGMAKGAGMIGPNMATMLCQLITDAPLSPTDAQAVLTRVANQSFNNISVEGHTSTNDTMLLLANGQAGGAELVGAQVAVFENALANLCIELAKMIPTDGEGASHLIEVNVSGAQNDDDARAIADAVASSNLVKTAVYGADPNWGRIVSAAGYAGRPLEVSSLALSINGFQLFSCGEPIPFDEAGASNSIRQSPTTKIDLTVGSGAGTCTHWTSDLSVEYVRFNSEYTT